MFRVNKVLKRNSIYQSLPVHERDFTYFRKYPVDSETVRGRLFFSSDKEPKETAPGPSSAWPSSSKVGLSEMFQKQKCSSCGNECLIVDLRTLSQSGGEGVRPNPN